ncbi:YbgC/FadM family acyl-CoA thioesterase [Sphingomonas jatrophae]|uniref:Acyl-CoA thioester hydrolase n=1 Tax=Sphingomonas jatrophae TaxID=1166337 RepID=A0A1I6LKX6_9SPHN|nr:YbgC/FadM family acyl-CoA thioesterase [Sphingomonas jatrophae]SFS04197.1 acyl-CoA thioester hydrolase [Sphingomonas jatrophae]
MTGSDPTIEPPSLGAFSGKVHRLPLRVWFEDTDITGIVYHANYVRYLERGRSAMLALAGAGQRAVWDAGEGAYAITELTLRYRRPARLEDVLVVESRLTALRPVSCVIQQRVMRDVEVLVEAEVTAAFLDASGRPRRQPASWMERFRPLLKTGDE